MEQKYLQKGNRKLPKTTLIFNLPSGKTCPMATKECKQYCYAKKAERMYPNVLPFREKCLKLSKTNRFVDIITNEINQHIKNDKVKPTHFRFHESGDVYSKEYMYSIEEIVVSFPKILFYLYTKNINTHKGICKHKNLITLFSDDSKKYTLKQLKEKGFKGRARVDNGRKITKGEFICPGSCKECDYCFSSKKYFRQIVFSKH